MIFLFCPPKPYIGQVNEKAILFCPGAHVRDGQAMTTVCFSQAYECSLFVPFPFALQLQVKL
jgi:hypothetical protein